MVDPKWLPSRAWSGIPSREPERLPQWNEGKRVERDRALDRGSRKVSHLLAQWTCRDGKIYNRANPCREGIRQRPPRSVIFLLEGFRGSQQSPVHLSHIGIPACTKVPRLPILAYPPPPIQPGRRARVASRTDAKVSRRSAPLLRYLNRYCDRCPRRMQGRRPGICPPPRARTVYFQDSPGQILHHQQTRNVHHVWVPCPVAEEIDGCLHSP